MTEIETLGYLSDLHSYYKASYGFSPLAEKLPCAAVKDMYDTIHSVSGADNPLKVTAYFTHSTMLLMLITAFGLKHDQLPLRGDNFDRQQNRQFKTSQLVPYASNLAAVKYGCDNGREDKVLFLLNQRPVSMPWCADGEICTINEIGNMFGNSTMHNCPCDICGTEFAILSVRNIPASIVRPVNVSCIPPQMRMPVSSGASLCAAKKSSSGVQASVPLFVALNSSSSSFATVNVTELSDTTDFFLNSFSPDSLLSGGLELI